MNECNFHKRIPYTIVYGSWTANSHLRSLRSVFPGQRGNQYAKGPCLLVPNASEMWNSEKYRKKGCVFAIRKFFEFSKSMKRTHGDLFRTLEAVNVRYTKQNNLYFQFKIKQANSFRTLMVDRRNKQWRIRIDNIKHVFDWDTDDERASALLLSLGNPIIDKRFSHLNCMM